VSLDPISRHRSSNYAGAARSDPGARHSSLPAGARDLAAGEGYRVLRPAGRLSCMTPDRISHGHLVPHGRRSLFADGHEDAHFTLDAIREHLVNARFESYEVMDPQPCMAIKRAPEMPGSSMVNTSVNIYGPACG
jgi:hypothetical protein